MKPHYDKDGITIYNADCLETMKLFEDKFNRFNRNRPTLWIRVYG